MADYLTMRKVIKEYLKGGEKTREEAVEFLFCAIYVVLKELQNEGELLRREAKEIQEEGGLGVSQEKKE